LYCKINDIVSAIISLSVSQPCIVDSIELDFISPRFSLKCHFSFSRQRFLSGTKFKFGKN
jgi:hypothetical protein